MNELGLELDLEMVTANEKVPGAILGEPSRSFPEHVLLPAAMQSAGPTRVCGVLHSQVSKQRPMPLNGHLPVAMADLSTQPLRVGAGSEAGSTFGR